MKGIVTILGSGTSQGVPVIACDCHVCQSTSRKDKRSRSSILISTEQTSIVIDTGPDFRMQMLRENVKSLQAVVFTHEHKDHIAGLDDVRAFNYRDQKPMEIFCTAGVEKALKREYEYAFADSKYPGIPQLNLNIIDTNAFTINDVTLLPILVYHYQLPVFGYRIGDLTYITDAKTILPKEMEKVKGCKTLIVNALHREKHISHFNLDEALAFIDWVKPEKAYLTHISHLFETHNKINELLPENVFAAYDGLKLPFEY